LEKLLQVARGVQRPRGVVSVASTARRQRGALEVPPVLAGVVEGVPVIDVGAADARARVGAVREEVCTRAERHAIACVHGAKSAHEGLLQHGVAVYMEDDSTPPFAQIQQVAQAGVRRAHVHGALENIFEVRASLRRARGVRPTHRLHLHHDALAHAHGVGCAAQIDAARAVVQRREVRASVHAIMRVVFDAGKRREAEHLLEDVHPDVLHHDSDLHTEIDV